MEKIKIDAAGIKAKYPTFNKDKDRGVVLQGLGPNLSKIITSGQVPTGTTPVVYNELSMVEVSGRVNDKFDFLGNEIRAKGIAASAAAQSGSGSVGQSGVASVKDE